MALNEEQIQKIRHTLSTSGWYEVMKPALENRGRNAVKALTQSRSERAVEYKGTDFDTDDDVLRAVIRDCTWMVGCWGNEIAVAEHNRTLDELDRQSASGPNG